MSAAVATMISGVALLVVFLLVGWNLRRVRRRRRAGGGEGSDERR